MNELIKRIDDALGQFCICTAEWDLLSDCRAEIERLTKPYVPMTADEINSMMQNWYNDTTTHTELTTYIEAAVIKRYNEQRGVK